MMSPAASSAALARKEVMALPISSANRRASE